MLKKGLLLMTVCALLAAGCSSSSSGQRKSCTKANGEVFYIDDNQVCCGDSAVDMSDLNCGGCGVKCINGNHCDLELEQCVCSTQNNEYCALNCTANGCVDLSKDPDNCGEEGHKCNDGEVCSGGSCSATCGESLEKCGNTCVNLHSDVSNCGACGIVCPAADASKHVKSAFCQDSTCRIVCEDNYFDDDGDLTNGCEREASFVCGNGIVEVDKGEVCDGTSLNDKTCEKIVGVGSVGTLLCNSSCTGFDASGCSPSTTCGNNIIDGNDLCDGSAPITKTCADVLGAGSTGRLFCDANCSGYDTSDCSAPTTCGNGKIDVNEVCDGEVLNGATCATAVGMGSSGTLKCASNCSEYDKSGCTAAAVCGNGILEVGESCDGLNFNGSTCESIIGPGSKGQLVCTGCRISTENCSAASTCGNSIVDGNEVCDGTALNGATCASTVGEGSTGRLACKDNCSGFDISGCTASSLCGDGIVEPGEVCDGAKLNDRTCATEVGLGSTGTLVCNSTCTGFDTSHCTASTTCGNGIIEAGEVCDGSNIKNMTCDALVGNGSKGMVLCASDCKSYNLSGCSAATQCGNKQIDVGEVCDGTNLKGQTCASVLGAGSTGTLRCGDGCKHFDTSSCSPAKSCGDGKIDDGEVCDGSLLAGRTCENVVGFGSKGVLKCNPTCTGFDTSMCTAEVTCGNGRLDPGEKCDGQLLNGATCSALVGFGSTGVLKCNSSCSGYELSGCSAKKTCGDGVLDSSEICDGSLLNGKTCEDLVGFGSTGVPACNSTCSGYTKGTCTPAKTCGNGKLDSGEQCDSSFLNGATCESVVGLGSTGTLLCDSSCRFNTTNCTASRGCGNGKIEDSEFCDGSSFKDSKACASYDSYLYESGTLACTEACTADTSSCKLLCGNGVTNKSKGEVCDGTNLNYQTCEKQVGPGSVGTLACADDCRSFDISGCSEAKYCGDGKVNADSEECDGTSFRVGSDACSSYSAAYSSGKLKCLSNCKVDVSACEAKARCGDGMVNQTNEVCDGTAFKNNIKSCAALDPTRYSSGNVTCNSDCTLNYNACVVIPEKTCGNGVVDENEFCDGNKFVDNITCSEWDSAFDDSGSLKCTADCQIDDSGCKKKASCGNNVLDSGEVCDGTKFSGNKTSCKTLFGDRYGSGSVKCTQTCEYDTSECVAWCGNGSVNVNTYVHEDCDPKSSISNSKTCANVMGTGYTGTLKCDPNSCLWDTTGCVPPAAPKCGDKTVNQASEQCDGTAIRDNKTACTDWNDVAYESGNVSCNSDCTINYSACKAKPSAVCGDGVINQTSEECDGSTFKDGVKSCAAYDSTKYASGTLSCINCKIVTSGCVPVTVSKCGNNVIDDDEDEECDGTDLLYESCADFNPDLYASGKMGCSKDCKLTTAACVAHKCGDGVVAPDEYCDKTAFYDGNTSCTAYSSKYASGSLKCTPTCEIDDSACKFKCGNGIVDEGEYCDGSNYLTGVDTCDDWLPGTKGNLHCTSTCEVDFSDCKAAPDAYCGDGEVNQNSEECDKSAFLLDVNSCADYSLDYVSGGLKCTAGCKVDTSACVKKPTPSCGNNIVDGDEECDGSAFLLDVKTCADYSNIYASGTLSCNKDCKVETNACVRKCPFEGQVRCNGQDIEVCISSDGWEHVQTCNASQYCNVISETDANCETKPTESIDLAWCTFHWLAQDDRHTGYGRVLLPSGMDIDDVRAYMVCTNDLTKPVVDWKPLVEAENNSACSNCGSNKEFMTTAAYKGVGGNNYCTFVFSFDDKDNMFACRPQQTGASAPIRLTEKTTLTADLTRSFTSTACDEGSSKCSGNSVLLCDGGDWVVYDTCSASEECAVGASGEADCKESSSGIMSYDNTETMTGWGISASYTKINTNTSYPDTSEISVTGAFYKDTHIIDGITGVLSYSNNPSSGVVISKLTAGIGTLSFKYMTWGSSDTAVLEISDETNTQSLTVKKTDTNVQTWSYSFNSKTATTVTIKPKSGKRVLIDDIRWTSAP